MNVITNGVPRDVLDGWELSTSERKDFDYLDWYAIEEGRDSASFFRYKGELYDLGEFVSSNGLTDPLLTGWDGYQPNSYFSGLLVRYVDDFERIVIGRYYT